MENTKLIMWVVGALFTILSAYYWYDKKKSDAETDRLRSKIEGLKDTVSNLEKQVHDHSTKYITDQRSRDIALYELQPVKEDVNQIKSNLNSIMTSLTDLTTELKISNAIRDYEKSQHKAER